MLDELLKELEDIIEAKTSDLIPVIGRGGFKHYKKFDAPTYGHKPARIFSKKDIRKVDILNKKELNKILPPAKPKDPKKIQTTAITQPQAQKGVIRALAASVSFSIDDLENILNEYQYKSIADLEVKRKKEAERIKYGDKMARKAKRQIAVMKILHKKPMPEKGKYGQDVYATVDMQRAADEKKAKRTAISPDERKMLLKADLDLSNDLQDILNDVYDYTKEKQSRDTLRKSGLNPSVMKTKSSARQRELKKMMKYDAMQKSKMRQKEARRQKAIASVQR